MYGPFVCMRYRRVYKGFPFKGPYSGYHVATLRVLVLFRAPSSQKGQAVYSWISVGSCLPCDTLRGLFEAHVAAALMSPLTYPKPWAETNSPQ